MRRSAIAALVILDAALVGFVAVWFVRTPTPEVATYEAQLAECRSFPDNSVQKQVETDRAFINLPRAQYPQADLDAFFTTVSGDATAGYVSNGGPRGSAFQSSPDCTSTYYEFDGTGELELSVPSTEAGEPDYVVRFLVIAPSS